LLTREHTLVFFDETAVSGSPNSVPTIMVYVEGTISYIRKIARLRTRRYRFKPRQRGITLIYIDFSSDFNGTTMGFPIETAPSGDY